MSETNSTKRTEKFGEHIFALFINDCYPNGPPEADELLCITVKFEDWLRANLERKDLKEAWLKDYTAYTAEITNTVLQEGIDDGSLVGTWELGPNHKPVRVFTPKKKEG
jgi:hypothetical protein